jgi:hypothetical protein
MGRRQQAVFSPPTTYDLPPTVIVLPLRANSGHN